MLTEYAPERIAPAAARTSLPAPCPPGEAPLALLRRVFGYERFRGLQEEAVSRLVGGGDALVLMPTGGGKSLCYQIPALCRSGTAIVVSPLIALMDDQVAALRQLGIAAAALHSELEPDEARANARALADGMLDLLYVSPERLLAEGTLGRLSRVDIALIAIDEAHCVSAWGHEFRPEYRALACLPRHFPGVPRIALTATADARTRADIVAALDMPQAQTFAASFHRANLHVEARPKEGELAQLDTFLARHAEEAGIVYCGSRAKTERVATRLREKGRPALPFHAGLAPMEKRAALARFRAGEPMVVVATIAFGMGIDRPDVRFVAHLDMPDSPEGYYQQIGRAGRDGDRAETLLLFGGEDIGRARRFLAQSTAPEAEREIRRQRLDAMIGLAETTSCRTRALLGCFGEMLAADCGHCDNCLSPRASFDGTVAAQKVLSAVYRTGQRFGALHVVAVLRGEANDAASRLGHDRLSVFGAGRDRPGTFWRGVIRQLLARGALAVGAGEYATLELVSEAARPILRGETAVMLHEDPAPVRRPTSRAAAAPSVPGSAAEQSRFEALRRWRAGEAATQKVPPYVIFHDSVLRDIAMLRMPDRTGLAQVRGVGASKLERYGSAVLRALES